MKTILPEITVSLQEYNVIKEKLIIDGYFGVIAFGVEQIIDECEGMDTELMGAR